MTPSSAATLFLSMARVLEQNWQVTSFSLTMSNSLANESWQIEHVSILENSFSVDSDAIEVPVEGEILRRDILEGV